MGTRGRFGQRAASPSRPPRCLAWGSLHTSLILPATPAASPGGWATGRREAGADAGARGLCRPSQGESWGPGEGAGAPGNNAGGRGPPPLHLSYFTTAMEDTPLFLHMASGASPGVSSACPAWHLGLLTFFEKCGCAARGS